MTPDGPCTFLEWDSAFFNCRIARMECDTLDEEAAALANTWCADHQIDCLYVSAGADDPETVLVAERHAYHLVDVAIMFEKSLSRAGAGGPSPPDGVIVREARATDMDTLARIARVSHGNTRFYHDGRLPRARVDDLYETWVRNSFAGYAQMVLVAEVERRPAGYYSLHLDGEPPGGRVGLVAVESSLRRRGIARALVEASEHWFVLHGAVHARTVTQARNVAMQRIYQQCGWRTRQVRYTYHKWFTKQADADD